MIRDENGLSLFERKAKECAECGDMLGVSYNLMRSRADFLDYEIEKIPRRLPWWRVIKRYKRMRLLAEYGQCQLDIGLVGHVIDPNDDLYT